MTLISMGICIAIALFVVLMSLIIAIVLKAGRPMGRASLPFDARHRGRRHPNAADYSTDTTTPFLTGMAANQFLAHTPGSSPDHGGRSDSGHHPHSHDHQHGHSHDQYPTSQPAGDVGNSNDAAGSSGYDSGSSFDSGGSSFDSGSSSSDSGSSSCDSGGSSGSD